MFPSGLDETSSWNEMASLLVFAMSFLLVKHAMSYYSGEDGAGMVGEQGEQEVVVEPELHTLFRDL